MVHDSIIAQKKIPVPWCIYILISVLTICVLLTVFFSYHISEKMISKYAPLVNTAMEIKLQASTGHLWFEEIISGNHTEGISIVWKYLDKAQYYTKVMLEGGTDPEGRFIVLDDQRLKSEISQMLEKLIDFRKISEKRYEAKVQVGIGSEIDRISDAVFREFLEKADDVEMNLQKLIARDRIRFRNTQIGLMVLVFALSVMVGIVFRRFERRRVLDYIEIHAARRKAEKNEKWLSTTMESMGEGVIITDSEGCARYMNPQAEHLTDWRNSEAKGKPISDLFKIINEDIGQEMINPVEKVLREKRITRHADHTVLISKNGRRYAIADSEAPIVDENEELLGVVMVFHDVTEKRKAEDEIRKLNENLEERVQYRTAQVEAANKELEERMQLIHILLDNMPCVAILIRPHSREIVASNEAAVKVGAIPGRGKHCYDTWAQRIAPCPFCLAPKVWETGQAQSVEIECEGTWSDAHWVPISEDLYLHYSFDITERKHAEQKALQQKYELAHASRLASMGQMASGLAHELNQPLCAITSFAESGIRMIKNKSFKSHDVLEIMQCVSDQAYRAGEIIRNLRIFIHKEPTKFSLVDICEIVKNSVVLAQDQISQKHAKIRLDLPNRPLLANANKIQIEQVIINFIQNALEAMDQTDIDRRKIIINASNMDDKMILVSVTDSGKGLSDIDISRIFDPFFTTKEDGMGIGLSINASIIEYHKGKLWTEDFESGATFKFTIPVTGKEEICSNQRFI